MVHNEQRDDASWRREPKTLLQLAIHKTINSASDPVVMRVVYMSDGTGLKVGVDQLKADGATAVHVSIRDVGRFSIKLDHGLAMAEAKG